MSSLARNFNRAASRQLWKYSNLGRRPLIQPLSVKLGVPNYRYQSRTMATIAKEPGGPNAASMSPISREYDPEITDMANYVHNYSVNSELAVGSSFTISGASADVRALASSTQLGTSFSTHWDAV